MSSSPPEEPCQACLARSWLIARLSPNLDRVRSRILPVLELEDEPLLDAVAGRGRAAVAGELRTFSAARARGEITAAGLWAVCRCMRSYPTPLREDPAAPAVLYVAGAGSGGRSRRGEIGCGETRRGESGLLWPEPAVAVVGTRRASSYGLAVATSLGRDLAVAGLAVVSGLAFGIDAAAHRGGLSASRTGEPPATAATIAVLPCGAEQPYPRSHHALWRRVRVAGLVVSELPPGSRAWRWSMLARNRIVAALAAMTIVVEAGEGSGALLTAGRAAELGRAVGAVPGQVSSPGAAGPNRLLAGGARLVRGAGDVLEALGAEPPTAGESEQDHDLTPAAAGLRAALAQSASLPEALRRAGLDAAAGLAALAELELAGQAIRGAGGRYAVAP